MKQRTIIKIAAAVACIACANMAGHSGIFSTDIAGLRKVRRLVPLKIDGVRGCEEPCYGGYGYWRRCQQFLSKTKAHWGGVSKMDAPDGIRCTSSSADITLASLPEWDFLSQRNCQPLSDESVGGVLNAYLTHHSCK